MTHQSSALLEKLSKATVNVCMNTTHSGIEMMTNLIREYFPEADPSRSSITGPEYATVNRGAYELVMAINGEGEQHTHNAMMVFETLLSNDL